MADHPTPTPARQLTEKQIEQKQTAAFKLERKIRTGIGRLHKDGWALAEALTQFRETSAWVWVGYDSVGEWLSQPEVGISRSWFYKLTDSWRDLVQVREVSPARLLELEPTKVAEVLPAIRSGEVTVEKALADVEALARHDLREQYKRDGRGPNASLAAETEPVRIQCPTCGQWYTPPEEEAA